MRIVIVGPGALGSLLTARLCLRAAKANRAGNDFFHSIILLDYKPDRVAYLSQDGLFLEEGGETFHCHPEITVDPAVIRLADVLFFCVKTTVFSAVLAGIKPFISSRALFIAMQNGIGHLEALSSINCLGCVGITSEGAAMLQAGHVRHGGSGLTRIGLLKDGTGGGDLLMQTAEMLNAAGFSTQVTGSPLRHVWGKLLVNVGINALTALHRCKNGELLDSPSIMNTMRLAVEEAESIARMQGIPITEDPVMETCRVCEMTGNNISSMLQDVLRKRPTEIDAINGAIVAAGKRLGVPTPVNTELVRRVREIEQSYMQSDEKRNDLD